MEAKSRNWERPIRTVMLKRCNWLCSEDSVWKGYGISKALQCLQKRFQNLKPISRLSDHRNEGWMRTCLDNAWQVKDYEIIPVNDASHRVVKRVGEALYIGSDYLEFDWMTSGISLSKHTRPFCVQLNGFDKRDSKQRRVPTTAWIHAYQQISSCRLFCYVVVGRRHALQPKAC